MLFTGNGKLGVFDFDDCGRGSFVFDMGAVAARHASHYIWAVERGRAIGDLDWARTHVAARAELTRYCLDLPY